MFRFACNGELDMRLIEIVEEGLTAGGFDGFVVPGVCGCIKGDLSPGDCISESCEAAYQHKHSKRPDDWITSVRKDGLTDEDIEKCLAECC